MKTFLHFLNWKYLRWFPSSCRADCCSKCLLQTLFAIWPRLWVIQVLLSDWANLKCFVSAYSDCLDLREVRADDEAVRERSRTSDICGDNGLMILIFTYLVARQVASNTCITTTASTVWGLQGTELSLQLVSTVTGGVWRGSSYTGRLYQLMTSHL